MKKLCVAGCSFSDYTKVEKTYGEILAKNLNYEYIHEGAGCGSNWRIWRTVTKHIMDGVLTADDLLIIQYTENSRNEFWSSLPNRYFKNTIDNLCVIDRSYDNGAVIRYKVGASVWQDNVEEKEFFNIYESYFVNSKFENERFKVNNYNFQHMLKNNNINVIFITSDRTPLRPKYILDHYQPYEFVDILTEERRLKFDLTLNDQGHMNQEGHYDLADRLYKHIKHLNL
jgi:hypothetical protein